MLIHISICFFYYVLPEIHKVLPEVFRAEKIYMQLSRRHFLKHTLLGVGTLAVSSRFGLNPITMAMAKEGLTYQPGSGKWVSTTCNGCSSFCAKKAYIQDERVIAIESNEHSKIHGKASCPRQWLSLQELYDPDRIKTPLLRTNPEKGRGVDPKFKPISWEQAVSLMADKLMELREKEETHKYVALRGRYSFLSDVLIKNFTKVLGSPNAITHSSICAESDKFSTYYTEGDWGYRQYDISKTRYILSFGADPLSANRQVSYYCSEWGNMLDNAQVAIVDPRFSVTASKADEWLPVTPGQDGALALALAHEILVNGGWHKPFVGDFVDGKNRFVAKQEVTENSFEEKHTYGLVKWWNLELRHRTPEWAEPLCGIDAKQVRQVAKKLMQAAPSVQIWRSRGSQMQLRGAYTGLACHALNGLLGSVDSEGGVLAYNKQPLTSMPSSAPYVDKLAAKGLEQERIDRCGRLELPALKKGKSGGGVVTNKVADSILSADPYEAEFVLGYFNNFSFSSPDGKRWEQALKQVPFVAHITTNPSEFSWFSDLVLPAPHFMFECWGVQSCSGNRHAHVSITQPMIKRLGDTVEDETGIPWLIASELDRRGVSAPLTYLREAYRDPETGAVPTNPDELALYATKISTQNMWDPKKYKGGDRFSGWEEFVKTGVWNSGPYKFQSRWSKMKTETGKFEFYSKTLKKALIKHSKRHHTDTDAVLEACNYTAKGEAGWIPHYEQPHRFGNEKDFPMLFVDHKSRLNREGRSANTRWFQANKDIDPGERKYQDVAKINPADAQAMGINDGDSIRIVSETGTIHTTAALWEGVRPGTVAKAYGQGHWAYGSTASAEFGKRALGGNNNELLPAAHEALSGSAAFYGQIGVRVEKA